MFRVTEMLSWYCGTLFISFNLFVCGCFKEPLCDKKKSGNHGVLTQAVTVSLTDCLDSGSFHGPRWRMEPGDLFIPIDSIEEEATLTCDAKGTPPPQYR